MHQTFEETNRARLAEVQTDTLAKISHTVSDIEQRVEVANRTSSELLDSTAEKLKELYAKSHAEAAKRADALEDAAFAKLKDQAGERLSKYKDTIEEKTSTLQDSVKDKLSETQALLKSFKSDWQAEAGEYLDATRAAMEDLDKKNAESASFITEKLRSASALTDSQAAEIENRLDAFAKDVDYRLGQFDKLIGDTEKLDAQLRIVMDETEKCVTGEFGLYAQDQQAKLDTFSKKLLGEADALSLRMATLESGLNELKSRAYENVSEKLKIFEDDFFADLAKRSDAITAALDHWKTNVDERLEALSSESEGSRKDFEAAQGIEFKNRLAEIGEQYRAQTAKIEEQIASIETELRERITASDESILVFTEQVRKEFELAREKASLDSKNELDAHALSIQEALRKQEREVEARTKEFAASIDAAKTESETTLELIRNGFAAWQARNDHDLAEAKTNLGDKLAALGSSTTAAISDLEGKYQTNYREFIAKTTEERKQYKETLDGLKKDMNQANADFKAEYAKTAVEADQSIQKTKALAQEIRESTEQIREKLVQKLQGDTGALSQTLDEIDKRQKGFIAQTKIFERADELKVSLENDIVSVKAEIARLDVYRDTMSNLEQQYQKVRKLEEDASQKVSRFTAEKKRIDIIESDFNKLLSLSDSIDKKMQELTTSNDDLQQYQVQIRRFEESVTEANGRYERLEKKAVVLDQTVSGIDKAFENLKSLESSLSTYREKLSTMPEEIEGIKRNLDTLLENREKTELIVEKISTLDTVLDDVEKRTEKMQTAREWLARTETRLEDISRQSQEQLKLLGDILKDDAVGKKGKGAPPIGIRENVVKLAHQGWKVDEIARALHLSRGEVELILELPSK